MSPSIMTRNLSNIDWEKARKDLEKVNWSQLKNLQSADEKLAFFENECSKILDNYAPVKKRRVKGFKIPWMNKEIIALISKRDQLKRIFLQSKFETDEKEFKKYRTFVNNTICKAKKYYFQNKCSAAKQSADVWKVYKELLNVCHKKSEPIKSLENDGTRVEDKNVICDLLAKQFALQGDDISGKIEKLQSELSKNLGDLLEHENEIIDSFLSLKSKSCTNSKIPYMFYSATIRTLAPTLKTLFNDFIESGRLPLSFNQAIITPLYKNKGSRTDPSNYRPVSNLCLLSKILEKAVYKKLYNFVAEKQILDTHQHGFRKRRSCFTAASIFAHDVLSHIGKPNVKCLAMFVDLKKAFDSICPLELLIKLLEFGVDPRIMMYLCAYFLNRTFRIKLGDFLSLIFILFKGCPQGGFYRLYFLRCFIMMWEARYFPPCTNYSPTILFFISSIKTQRS